MVKIVYLEGKQIEEFISDLGQNYKLDNFRIKNDIVVFEVSSVLKDVICPYCEQTSSKVYFRYHRDTGFADAK